MYIYCCITPATSPPPVSITVASVTPSGDNTVGESYSLECTVTVTGSTDQPTITWLDNGTEIISTTARMVSGVTGSAGSYSSTLTFSPLRASDAGMFMCRASLGNVTNSQAYDVAVLGECIRGIALNLDGIVLPLHSNPKMIVTFLQFLIQVSLSPVVHLVPLLLDPM